MHRYPWPLIAFAVYLAISALFVAMIGIYLPAISIYPPVIFLVIAVAIRWMQKTRAEEGLQLRGHRWIVGFFAGFGFLLSLPALEISVLSIADAGSGLAWLLVLMTMLIALSSSYLLWEIWISDCRSR